MNVWLCIRIFSKNILIAPNILVVEKHTAECRSNFIITSLWLADKVLDALEGEDELKLTAIETAKDELMDINR